MSRADYRAMVDIASAETSLENPEEVVAKEILHYDILHAMDRAGYLENLVFHGGTSLRLCHGAPRLSEDLDFCTGPGFREEMVAGLGQMLQTFLRDRYGLETRSSRPKKRGLDDVHVWRWWIRMEPRSVGRTYGGVPWTRVKLEIAEVEERNIEVARLIRNYSVVPDSHVETRLKASTKESILADKLIAFPRVLPIYVRWRDICDVQWLLVQETKVSPGIVRAKLKRYRIRDFDDTLAQAARQLDDLLGSEEIGKKLGDFVPLELAERTLRNRQWRRKVATEFRDLLEKLRKDLAGEPNDCGDGRRSSPHETPDSEGPPSLWNN